MAARSPSKTRAVPVNTESSKPAVLTTAPSGASEPLRMVRPPVAWIGRSSERSTSSSSGGRRDVGEVLGHRPAGHGEAVAVHQPGVEQRLHDDRDAADLVDVVHDVPAERLEVADVRHLVADPVEVVDGQVDLGLAGHRQQVQHGVGRAAERHHDGDRVLERLLGHDLARGDALPEQVDHGLAGAVREPVAAPVDGRRGGRSRAATCRSPRRPRPSCWRCTSRRRRPRPGRSPARSCRPARG